jgi:putative oxidoreductase
MTKRLSGWAPLPLRLVVGWGFVYHGLPKLFTSEGHRGFAASLQGMGIPLPELMAWVAGGVEVVGGIALILGTFVTVAAALLMLHQLVALFKVHLVAGFNFIHVTGMTPTGPQFGLPGYEVNLLYLASLLTLMLGGAGLYSVEQARAKRGESSDYAGA